MFQSGNVEPVVYTQDNSGIDTDTTTTVKYTPDEFGAPAGAKIVVGTVTQSQQVIRGSAHVEALDIQEESISFRVYTQSAGGGLFGHHSGAITVATGFQWYVRD